MGNRTQRNLGRSGVGVRELSSDLSELSEEVIAERVCQVRIAETMAKVAKPQHQMTRWAFKVKCGSMRVG
jgi:hypothetical protein